MSSSEQYHPEVSIPVFEVPPRGEVYEPGSSPSLDKLIVTKGRKVMEAGEHCLFSLPATAPHHPSQPHDVYWVFPKEPQSEQGMLHGWQETSWEDVIADRQFLEAVEQYVHNYRRQYPQSRWYFHMGYASKEESSLDAHVFKRGMQSIHRMHLHCTYPLTSDLVSSRVLHPQDPMYPDDLSKYELFLNAAGEKSIELLSGYLDGYGDIHCFEQPVGKPETHLLKRSLFIFNSLEEALRKSYGLQQSVKPQWAVHTNQVRSGEVTFAGVTFVPRQSIVPNVVVVFLSENDKLVSGLPADATIAACPFSLTSSQLVFMRGGGYLEAKRIR